MKSINRNAILQCIHRHLRNEPANEEAGRPLGEILPAIAHALRGTESLSESEACAIPLPWVAAFVDGKLSVEEEQSICHAVLHDNSVLAEIIAAIRMEYQWPSTPPLSPELNARLLSLIPPPTTAGSTTRSNMSKPTSIREPRRLSPTAMAAAILAIAASVLAFLGFRHLATEHPLDNQLSSNGSSIEPKPIDQAPTSDPSIPNPDGPQPEQMALPEQRATDPTPSVFGVEVVPDSTFVQNVQNDRSMSDEPPMEKPPRIDPGGTSDSTGSSSRIAMSGLRWTRIRGLLARQGDPVVPTDAEDRWQGVETGRREWNRDEDREGIRLRTLPMSRAEGAMNSGGKVVMAPDTGIEFQRAHGERPDQLDLEHGAIALVDFPRGSEIIVRSSGTDMASVRWESKGTVVFEVGRNGVQAQIDGAVRINQQLKRNAIVSLEHDKLADISNRPGKLPAWVGGSTDTNELPKGILMQFAKSDNIAKTMDQFLESKSTGPQDERAMGLIAGWQASLVDGNLYRLAISRRPMMRLVAFQRLMTLPEWDRRCRAMAMELERTIDDPRKFQILQRSFAMVRRGERPNREQMTQLASLLDAPDLASRALADLLLRHILGGGPVFDPTWTDQANARGKGLWLRYVNAANSGTVGNK